MWAESTPGSMCPNGVGYGGSSFFLLRLFARFSLGIRFHCLERARNDVMLFCGMMMDETLEGF